MLRPVPGTQEVLREHELLLLFHPPNYKCLGRAWCSLSQATEVRHRDVTRSLDPAS